MIDFHCHVDLYPRAREVHAEALARNAFTWLVTTSPKAFQATNSVLGQHDAMLISPGLHPEIVGERFHELDLLIDMIENVIAVGEIGLDGSKRYASSYLQQKQVFAAVVKRCHELGGRALSIHSRQAVADVLAVLRAFPDHGIPVLHWFTGTITELKCAINQGCWFSLGPAALNSVSGKVLASKIPRARIIPESDGPFAKFDGVPVMPWDFDVTVKLLSQIWLMPFDEVENILKSNASLFIKEIGVDLIL